MSDLNVRAAAPLNGNGGTLSRRSLLAGVAATVCIPPRAAGSVPRAVRMSAVAALTGFEGGRLLTRAAEEAVAREAPLFVDRIIELESRWSPPPGLHLMGDRSDQSRIIWVGSGDAIEVTAPIYFDGVTLDGGVSVPQDRASGRYDCLLAVHGSLGQEPRYLSNVHIGWLRIRRTKSVGLVVANVSQLRIDNLILQDIFCNAFIMSGVKDSYIARITASNIGDLKENGHRRGSAVCIFAETKPVTTWYDTRKILPTENLSIGSVDIRNTTDSAFYIHDEKKAGVRNVSIASVDIDTAGKDGFKTRVGPVGVRVGRIHARRIALRGVDIESNLTSVDEIVVTDAGFDAVGMIIGRYAAFSGGNAIGESIQTHPGGVSVIDCEDVTLGAIKVTGVRSNPVTSAEGHGLRLYNARNVKVRGIMADCGGNGARVSGGAKYSLSIAVSSPCLNGIVKQAVLVTSDGAGVSVDGEIKAIVSQRVGGPAVDAAVVNDACGVNVVVSIKSDEFPNYPAARASIKNLRDQCVRKNMVLPTVTEVRS